MSYPTLEQYNEAIQYPQTAFYDPELKSGKILTTGLGLPLALCGGFALTYSVQTSGKKYAIRCFHKKSDAIELRYGAISNKIKTLKSAYFVNFEFQKVGINVNGKTAPVVKMAWATGETLGEFLEKNYRNKEKVKALKASLTSLASFLESKGIAHGDIQPGNVMVSNEGKSIQLIDYDGMYVDEIRSLGGAELGHRNFQHTKRTAQAWNSYIDRFSFIELNLALGVLETHPDFWDLTKSDGDAILFKANDFVDPDNSMLFSKLVGLQQFSEDTRNFAAVCKASFASLPTLDDFIARKNIPQVSISISQEKTPVIQQYLGAFAVLDAANYAQCLRHVGDRVELIGKIVEVKEDKTRRGKPYVFINFGSWRGEIVKIAIWSEGLTALTNKPNASWVGKWISVTGLMEPPYQSKRFKYSHLSISITQNNQLHIISETDARYRLGSSTSAAKRVSTSSNRDVLEGIKGRTTQSKPTPQVPGHPLSKNQSVLATMKQQQSPPSRAPQKISRTSPPPANKTPKSGGENNWWLWGLAILFVLWLLFKR